MPDPTWPTTPLPKEGVESIKSCSYDKTDERLAELSKLRGNAGKNWKIHHKKKGTVSVLVKMEGD